MNDNQVLIKIYEEIDLYPEDGSDPEHDQQDLFEMLEWILELISQHLIK